MASSSGAISGGALPAPLLPFVETLPVETVVSERLAGLLERVPAHDWCHWEGVLADVPLAALTPAIRFDPRGPTRCVIARTDEAEIVVSGWLPGQGARFGEIDGRARILTGQGVEEGFALERKVWPGDLLTLAPGTRLRNAGAGMMVVLELRTPSEQPSGFPASS